MGKHLKNSANIELASKDNYCRHVCHSLLVSKASRALWGNLVALHISGNLVVEMADQVICICPCMLAWPDLLLVCNPSDPL